MSNVPPPPGAPPPPPGGAPPPPGGAPPPPGGGGGFPPPPPPGGGGFAPPPAPGFGQPYGQTGVSAPLAGFGARLGAFIIDLLITGAFTIPGYVALFAGPTEIEPCPDTGDFEPGQFCEVPTDGTWAVAIVLFLAAFVAGVVYWALLDGKRGASVGKRAVGLRVADIDTGQPIGVGRGVGRYFAKILSAIPCYLGFLWMLWDDRNQTWHDKMVSSVVVRDR